jgi:hypothetical protein
MDGCTHRSKGHYTYVRSNGALESSLKDDQTVQFEKPGLDGRKVWE